ncbi:MAG: pyridoxamine 5'-phosphate oxidase family protein [Acidimicrobiales bacterium]
MGRMRTEIDERLAAWLLAQPVFFVATAPLAGDGHVNCSPKGNRGELAVLGERRVAYLDQTGSGVETIAHLQENGRIVLMFCSFEGPPRVVRLHGTGNVSYPGSEGFASAAGCFPGAGGVGVRAIITVEVERVADSCGYGVPWMGFGGFRPTLDEWAERKGHEGIRSYWAEKNAAGIDGAPGVPEPAKPH